MNYELANQLKDAGFPQEDLFKHIDRYVDSGKVTSEDYSKISALEFEKKQDRCFIPTLSELIEACGDRFDCLWHYIDGWEAIEDWDVDMEGASINSKVGKGETPEEAVANLWLKLNKKDE